MDFLVIIFQAIEGFDAELLTHIIVHSLSHADYSEPSSSLRPSVKVKVEAGDGEPIESARRFKGEINKSGHLIVHKRYLRTRSNARSVARRPVCIKFERMNKRRRPREPKLKRISEGANDMDKG
jgi:hypothetical protein